MFDASAAGTSSSAVAVERAELTQFAAFRKQVGTGPSLLTRVSDPDERVAVLLVGAVDLGRPEASDFADAARPTGVRYSTSSYSTGLTSPRSNTTTPRTSSR